MSSLSKWLVILACLIPAIVIAAVPEGGAGPKAKPNVLFIAIDDLRTELGCYGNTQIKSPHIDRLAETGVTFSRAYCQQAVCNPSRASLMTGLRPDTIKVWDLVTDFRTTVPDVVTIPQHFRKHGYRALSYGKIFHNPLPDHVSWDEPHRWPKNAQHWSGAAMKRFNAFKQKLRDEGKNEYMINRLRPPAVEILDISDSEHFDGAIADQTIAAMRQMAKSDQPFFLATGFLRPHLPFVVPRKYWDLYERDKIPLAPNQSFPKGMPKVAYGTPSFGGFYELRAYMDYFDAPTPFEKPLAEARQRELKHGYYASVSFIDAQVGRILAELDRLGLRDNTIVVLWGDHGWKLGEHGGWCKQTNFEIDTHAPLIICDPHAKANGEKSASLVEFVDIYPTLCELAGLPVPEVLEGISLIPVLNDVSVKMKDAAFSQFPHSDKGKNYMGYTMRTDRYRLVEWLDRKTGKTTATELYDHETDPQENINIAELPESQKTVQALSTRLHRMIPSPLPKPLRPVLTIRNQRAVPVIVYWLKPDGNRLKRARLAPGKSFKCNTAIEHKFLVEDEGGGNPRVIEVKKMVQLEVVKVPKPNVLFIAVDDLNHWGGYRNHAVRTADWRYIRYANGDKELYDHRKDPYEWENLAEKPGSGKTINRLAKYLPKMDLPPKTKPSKTPNRKAPTSQNHN